MQYPSFCHSKALRTWLTPTPQEQDFRHARVGELPPEPAMGWPTVSIVVPSFNQVRYLERCLISILQQNYPKLELIVMDGGSTDGSRACIESLAPRLHYWQSQQDGGQSAAINEGFRHASGEILAYLNSDDVYLPTAPIHWAAHRFSTQPHIDIVQGHAYLIDADDTVFGFSAARPWRMLDFKLGIFGIPQCATFWRRRVYDAVGGFNEQVRTCMDGEFYLRTAQQGAIFSVVDQVFSGFRIHNQSITGSGRYRQEYQQKQEELRRELTVADPSSLERLLRHGTAKAQRLVNAFRFHPSKVMRQPTA
ncbi:MAG: glycosyltransferase family 2 protein [Polyangiales bacterium]